MSSEDEIVGRRGRGGAAGDDACRSIGGQACARAAGHRGADAQRGTGSRLCGRGEGPDPGFAAGPRPRGRRRTVSLCLGAEDRPGLGAGGAGPRAAGRHPGAGLPQGGRQGCGRVREPAVPRRRGARRRADRRARGLRHLGGLGRQDRGSDRRRPAGGRPVGLPGARRHRHRRCAEAGWGGGLQAGGRPDHGRSGGGEGVPRERRVRGATDLCLGHPRSGDAQHRPRPQADHPDGAPQPGEAARARLPASGVRQPLGRVRPRGAGLCGPARSRHRPAAGRALPPGEDRPLGRRLDGEEAHRLLRGPRGARADPHGAAGRRAVVGEGVRGGRPQGRLPGGDPARGRRPAGCPLQRHQLGQSRHAGLVVRPGGGRPAHRRDREGLGAAGLAAGAPGHADLRGPGGRRRKRKGRAERSDPGGVGPDPPAVGARGGPLSGLRAQLRRLQPGPRLGDGLPRPAGEADRRPDRPLRRLRGGRGQVGQLHRRLAVRRRRPDGQGEGRDGHPALHRRFRRAAGGLGPAARRDLGRRRRPGGGTGAGAGRAPRGHRPVRAPGAPARRGGPGAEAQVRADLSVAPLSARGGRQGPGRRGLQLRGAGRRGDEGRRGSRRAAARRAGRPAGGDDA